MRKRQTRRAQRAKDPPTEQQAKTTKKMDAYVSRPQEDPAAATCVASGGELTLNELVAELRIIRTSTNNIEKDTKQIKTTVQEIEGKINALSARMEEVESRVATLEEATHASEQQLPTIQEEIKNLRNHIEDLDNRGRRCNIRIIGIPELIEGEDMIKFLQREIPIMLDLTLEPRTLDIQRAHRVPMGPPKRSRREGERPRPVMVNLLRYRDKEDILRAAREKGQILWRGAKIMFFPDYSRRTMDRRMSFKQIKLELREKGVEYSLLFPATLEIKRNGARHRFSSPEEAAKFIKNMFP